VARGELGKGAAGDGELCVPRGLAGAGGWDQPEGQGEGQLGALWQESKAAVHIIIIWAQTAEERRDGKDKKEKWEEMVALGRGQPQAPSLEMLRSTRTGAGTGKAEGRRC